MARRRRSSPVRGPFVEDARESLCLVHRHDQTINVDLVALTDGVELEIWADGVLRRRLRFLRDTEARKYSERVAARLTRRGYTPVLPQ
jgi:hypothetical protein